MGDNNNNNKKFNILVGLFGTKRRKTISLFVGMTVLLLLYVMRNNRWIIRILSMILPNFILERTGLKSIAEREDLQIYNNLLLSPTNITPLPDDDLSLSPPKPNYSTNNNNSNNNSSIKSTTTISTLKLKPAPRISLNHIQSRKVTLSTLDIIIKKVIESPDHSNNHGQMEKKTRYHYQMIESQIEPLIKLAQNSDLYLLTRIQEDNEEEQVIQLLKDNGLLNNNRINPHKVLFCSTSQGKAHISRHLEALVHIDDEYNILQMLKPYVQYLVHIDDGTITTTTTTTTTTMTSSSLSSTITTTTSNNNNSLALSGGNQYNPNGQPNNDLLDKQRIATALSLYDYLNNK